MLNILKLSLKSTIAVILIALPFGYYLYQEERDSINFEVNFPGGLIISKNICENIVGNNIIVPQIRPYENISKSLNNNYKEHAFRKFDGRLEYDPSKNLYKIIYKAKASFIGDMKVDAINIANNTLAAENDIYLKYYKNVNVYCQSNFYKAFEYVPLNTKEVKFFTANRHSKLFSFILLLLPFGFIYILILTYRIIKIMKVIENNNTALYE